MFERIWKSHPGVLTRRVAILYLFLGICRVVFWLYNRDIIGSIRPGELWQLFTGSLRFDTVSIIYAYGLFIFLSLVPFTFRENRIYKKILAWYFFIVTPLVIGINLADAVYFHYTQIRLTSADLIFAGNDNSFQLVMQFACENWYMVLTWIVLSATAILLFRATGHPRSPLGNRAGYYIINTVTLALTVVICIAGTRGGSLSREQRPITMSNATAYTPSPAKAGMILSNPFCIIRTAGSAGIEYVKYFSETELEKIYTPYHFPVTQPNDTTRLRNVMIFVLESFSAEHSALLNPDIYPEGNGYTPFLDSLMQQGYYFTRAFANGRKSIDALPSVLASTPSFKTPFVLMPQSLSPSYPLPAILADKGYETLFFCGSSPGSMGFDAYANSCGMQRIIDRSDYDRRNPGNKNYDGFWGIWDEGFIDFAGEVLSETAQPFLGTLFTITSHHPFRVPEKYERTLPEGKTKVHKGVAYTDMSIRKFFEKYSGQQWFENTLFVFTADHVSSERYAAKTDVLPGNQHILTFMYSPSDSLRGRNENVFQQLDIMPTVLGLLGHDQPYFAFGRDIFNELQRMPSAVGYNSAFFLITDNGTLQYDGNEVINYITANGIEDNPDERNYNPLELQYLQAIIQQYYSRLEQRNLTVGYTQK